MARRCVRMLLKSRVNIALNPSFPGNFMGFCGCVPSFLVVLLVIHALHDLVIALFISTTEVPCAIWRTLVRISWCLCLVKVVIESCRWHFQKCGTQKCWPRTYLHLFATFLHTTPIVSTWFILWNIVILLVLSTVFHLHQWPIESIAVISMRM